MIIKLKIIIKILVFWSCFLLLSCQDKNDKIVFFVAGHTYGSPMSEQLGIYPPFKAKLNFINECNPNFIALTGDMVKKPKNENWAAFKKDLNQLKAPIIKAPGNHDMGDRELYKQVNGNTDSLFSINGNQFIVLDNTKNGWGLDSSQLKLIKKALLKTHENKNIFIFCHNIMWHKINTCFTPNSLAGKAPEPYFNFWTEVEPLLKESNKNIYFFGGDVGAINTSKNVAFLMDKNIHYVSSGMGNGIFDNFLQITVDNTVKIGLIPLHLSSTNLNIKRFDCR